MFAFCRVLFCTDNQYWKQIRLSSPLCCTVLWLSQRNYNFPQWVGFNSRTSHTTVEHVTAKALQPGIPRVKQKWKHRLTNWCSVLMLVSINQQSYNDADDHHNENNDNDDSYDWYWHRRWSWNHATCIDTISHTSDTATLLHCFNTSVTAKWRASGL